MVLPAITFNQVDYVFQYGIRQVFWFGRSNCNEIGGQFHCDDRVNWLTDDGWQSLLRGYVSATGLTDGIEAGMKSVLWMYIPNFSTNGGMSEIRNITKQVTDNQQVWDDLDSIRNITEASYNKTLSQPQQDALERLSQRGDLFKTLETEDTSFMNLIVP